MTEVNELSALLKSIASRMENGAGELRKDMLEEVAEKLVALEVVAKTAAELVDEVPVQGDGSVKSKVRRETVKELISALNAAGRYGPNGSHVPVRRP